MTAYLIFSSNPEKDHLNQIGEFSPAGKLQVCKISAKNSTDIQPIRELCRKAILEGHTVGMREEAFKPEAYFFDMDSTLIQQESIVELARTSGKSKEVSEITERAMSGKLDFNAALKARVAVLEGLPETIIEDTLQNLTLSKGVESFIKTAQAHKAKIFLVSGGFKSLAGPIAEKLKLTDFYANTLEIKDKKLTGKVVGTIVNGEEKKNWLLKMLKTHNLNPNNIVAIGDGANDLAMMQKSFYSVGFSPKKILYKHVSFLNNLADHEAMIDFFY